MKKLSSVSLFIFGVVVTAILTAGLVFYQNDKEQVVSSSQNINLVQNAISKNGIPVKKDIPISTLETKIQNTNTNTNKNNDTATTDVIIKSLVLSMSEIKKHNNQNDCWMLINGKVYDITTYFGKHPGGNNKMIPTCGTDATNAYMTQKPNAVSPGSKSEHSSKANNLLNDYYLGNLDQVIS